MNSAFPLLFLRSTSFPSLHRSNFYYEYYRNHSSPFLLLPCLQTRTFSAVWGFLNLRKGIFCPPKHFSHFLMTYPCFNCHMVFPRMYLYITISLFISLWTFELSQFLLLHKTCACMSLLAHTGKCLGDTCWLRVGESLFAKLCPFAPFLAVTSSLSSTFSPTLARCSFHWYICCKYLLPGWHLSLGWGLVL